MHDDIVVLNSSTTPTAADFYQVKSKDPGTWSSTSLIRRAPPPKPKRVGRGKPTTKATTVSQKESILGKLYSNFVRFPSFVRTMSFVTNAHFTFKMAKAPACTAREIFGAVEIDKVEHNKIEKGIAAEHGLATPLAGLPHLFFVRTPLSVLDHDLHSEGIVCAFLTRRGDDSIPPAPFHRTLRTEIRRKNDYELLPATFDDLRKTKGICRKDMDRMLALVPSQRRMDDIASLIRGQATHEAFDLRRQSSLSAEVRNYLANRLDETNLVLAEARAAASQAVSALPKSAFASSAPLSTIISVVSALPRGEFENVRGLYSTDYLHAIIAVAIYESAELSTPRQKSSEENS